MIQVRVVLGAVIIGALVAGSLSAGPVLTLSPASNLTGAPAATVGWGFTLTNAVNWIEVVQAQFCLDSPVRNPCFTPSFQFFDIISNPPQDVIVGPGGSTSQPYNPGSNQGLGSFTIDPGAPNGSTVSGNILLTYNTFDNDPNQGGNQIGFNDAISTPASVTAVPEPASATFMGLAGAALLLSRLRRR